ncbi:MAG: hypothetical protein JXQ99_06085 [Hyphomicrobiaceae bacterium]
MTDIGSDNDNKASHPGENAPPQPAPARQVAPSLEQQLSLAVSAGEPIDLGGQQLDAAVLRRLITGQTAECTVTPFGVRIRNGELRGRLDLEGADVPFPLALTRISMKTGGQNGSIVARDARIRRLNVSNCTLAGGIVADRAEFANGIIIAGGRLGGPVLVRGCEIGGALAIEGAHLGDGKVALLAAGARVAGPLVLRRARAHGGVRIQRAHLAAGVRADQLQVDGEEACIYADAGRIGGDILLSQAHVAGPVSFENTAVQGAFVAQSLVVDAPEAGLNAGGLELSQGLDLSGAKLTGPLILEGAAIGKRLLAEAVEIDGGETAIAADVVHVGGNWEMPQARLVGQMRCPGARIGGQLRCSGMRIYGSELAVRGDGAHIDGGVFFSRAVIVGSVRFPAAKVGNQFRFSGATIKVDSGAALLASGAMLHRDAELNGGFQTIGGVVLDQAHIHGNCDFTTSHIKSVAVAAAGAGPPPSGMRGADLSPNDIAISLIDTNIDRLEMPSRADERPRGIVDLSRARVGAYVDWAATWPPAARSQAPEADASAADYLVLDGFTYEHLENPAGVAVAAERAARRRERAGQRRISWLLGQAAVNTERRFKPQAWVYLSKQLIAQGLDRDARLITIERRRRERMSRWSTASARWESRFLDWFALYGFNPWRTVVWMVAVILLFAGLWAWSASHCSRPGCFDERVFVTAKRDAFSAERFTERYPAFHPVAYSFDVFVPFVSFGFEDHWRPNINYQPLATWRLPHIPAFLSGETDRRRIFANVTITTGGILYVLVIVEKLLGLILTSLMLTGFTGLLRGHE